LPPELPCIPLTATARNVRPTPAIVAAVMLAPGKGATMSSKSPPTD
jgi:hypothetical protein